MTKKLSKSDHLKSLGNQNTTYHYEGADPSLLERIPNPMNAGAGVGRLHIVCPEFTSLCPKTGQPDYATIVIKYLPKNWCVESKSLKLFLNSFRQVGEFHESCVRRITNALLVLLDPWELKVEGQFTPRGGIPFWPEIEYERPQFRFELESEPPLGFSPEQKEGMQITLMNEAAEDGELLVQYNGEVVGYAWTDVETGETMVVDYRDVSSFSTLVDHTLH